MVIVNKTKRDIMFIWNVTKFCVAYKKTVAYLLIKAYNM